MWIETLSCKELTVDGVEEWCSRLFLVSFNVVAVMEVW